MAMHREREDADQRLARRDNWIDEAIGEAQRRGDFDDLPGQGKPLRLDGNPLAPEWDMPFSVLKNAGVAPYWIELDKEIRADRAALAALREHTARDLAAPVDRVRARGAGPQRSTPVPAPDDTRKRRSASAWWPFRRERTNERPVEDTRLPRLADLEATRQRARKEYLAQAAKLDKKIAAYNAALPSDLWSHERPRLPADRAAQEFDESCPPIPRET